MKDSIKSYIEKLKRNKQYRRRILAVAGVLAIFVAAGVFWNLRIIGITMANQPMCGLEEHVHTEECIISKTLICGYDDETDEPDVQLPDEEETTVKVLDCQLVVHEHTFDCYNEENELICGYADYVIHQHDEMCFDENGVLVCTLPEIFPHTHTDECYQETTTWLCGLEEGEEGEAHIHTDDCYETTETYICSYEEGDIVTVHTHDDNCYDEEGNLICTEETETQHFHDDTCLLIENTLICELEETAEPHFHTEDCPSTTERTAVCGLEEVIYHIHDLDLHDGNDTYCLDLETGELCCGLIETDIHQHTEECWKEVTVTGDDDVLIDDDSIIQSLSFVNIPEFLTGDMTDAITQDDFSGSAEEGELYYEEELADNNETDAADGDVIVDNDPIDNNIAVDDEPIIDAPAEKHVHTDECYEIIYGCGYEEHIHSLACYADINADVETLADWVEMTNEVRSMLDEDCEDGETVPPHFYLYYIAQSQVGYEESEFNFTLMDGVRKGYNRYSDWMTGGQSPYSDWNASFVAFCLHFAGIDNIPVSLGVNSWQVMLENNDLFVPVGETALYGASDYFPAPGDIIFLDTNGDGLSDRVGMISDYGDDGDSFVVIEGDCAGDPITSGGISALSTTVNGSELIDEPADDEQENKSYVYEPIVRDCVDYREYGFNDSSVMGFVSITKMEDIKTLAAYVSPRAYNELAYEKDYKGSDVVVGDYSDLYTLGEFALVNVGAPKTETVTKTEITGYRLAIYDTGEEQRDYAGAKSDWTFVSTGDCDPSASRGNAIAFKMKQTIDGKDYYLRIDSSTGELSLVDNYWSATSLNCFLSSTETGMIEPGAFKGVICTHNGESRTSPQYQSYYLARKDRDKYYADFATFSGASDQLKPNYSADGSCDISGISNDEAKHVIRVVSGYDFKNGQPSVDDYSLMSVIGVYKITTNFESARLQLLPIEDTRTETTTTTTPLAINYSAASSNDIVGASVDGSKINISSKINTSAYCNWIIRKNANDGPYYVFASDRSREINLVSHDDSDNGVYRGGEVSLVAGNAYAESDQLLLISADNNTFVFSNRWYRDNYYLCFDATTNKLTSVAGNGSYNNVDTNTQTAKFYLFDESGNRILSDQFVVGNDTKVSIIAEVNGNYYALSDDSSFKLIGEPVNLTQHDSSGNYTDIAKHLRWDALRFADNGIATQARIQLNGKELYIPVWSHLKKTGEALTLTDQISSVHGSKFDFITVKGNAQDGSEDYVLIRSLVGQNVDGYSGPTNYYLAVDDNNNLIYKELYSVDNARNDPSTHFRIYINDPRDQEFDSEQIVVSDHKYSTIFNQWGYDFTTRELRLNINVGDELTIDLVKSIFFDPSATHQECNSYDAVIKAAADDAANDQMSFITYYNYGDTSIASVAFEKGTQTATLWHDGKQDQYASACDTLHMVGKKEGVTDVIMMVYTGDGSDGQPQYNKLIIHLAVGEEYAEQVYEGSKKRYYHLDVEVDAVFDIIVYNSNGEMDVKQPKNVQVESVYSFVYNTATWKNPDTGNIEPVPWDIEYHNKPVNNDGTTHWRAPHLFWGHAGNYTNPLVFPWLTFTSSRDGKNYPIKNGDTYAYDQYEIVDGKEGELRNYLNNGPNGNGWEESPDLNNDQRLRSYFVLENGNLKEKYSADQIINGTIPDYPMSAYVYNNAYGENQPFRFGTDPTGKIVAGGYIESNSDYNGVQTLGVGYNPRAVQANGQFEFLTYGFGWMEFYDGDTVDLHVTISYEDPDQEGVKYYTEKVVTVVICDANNVCPQRYAGDNIIHGFDVEVIFDDVIEIESTGLTKTDQYGTAVPGATFAFYKGNGSGGRDGNDPVYTATSDANGRFNFVDAEGKVMSMADFFNLFEFDKNGPYQFIMEEVSAPAGYRKLPTDAVFHFDVGVANGQAGALDSTGSYMFVICDNTYDTGVIANPNALIQAPTKLRKADDSGQTYTYYSIKSKEEDLNGDGVMETYTVLETQGELYAVVLKRRGANLHAFDYGTPVYGNDFDGYQIWDMTNKSTQDAVNEMIEKGIGVYKFDISGSGMSIITSIKDIPGNIKQYYDYVYAMGYDANQYDDDLEFFIAYYYRPNDGAATGDKFIRVNSIYDFNDSEFHNIQNELFDIHWSTNIEIPDIENRLFFQKTDVDGNLVSDAVFALYSVREFNIDGQTVLGYRDTGTGYFALYPDSDDPSALSGTAYRIITENDGSAYIDETTPYTYTTNVWNYDRTSEGYVIDEYTGVINLTKAGDEDATAWVFPARNTDASKKYVGITHDGCTVVGLDGTGHFGKIPEGDYVLREIIAPAGYSVNPTEVLVRVDGLGVYANAGTSDNDVRVGNGVGYLVSTMNAYATEASVNESLAWIYAESVGNSGLTFAEFNDVKDWMHINSADFENRDSKNGYTYLVYDGYEDSSVPGYEALSPSDYEEGGHSLFDYRTSRNQAREGNTIWLFNPVTNEYTDLRVPYRRSTPDGDGTRYLAAVEKDEDTSAFNPPSLILYTDNGWSAVRVFQDYEYGHTVTTQNDNYARYDYLAEDGIYSNLSDDYNVSLLTPKNITDLFSGSTFVEVTDHPNVDLTIVKSFDDIAEGDTNTVRPDARFVLSKVGDGYSTETRSITSRNRVVAENEAYNYKLPDDLVINKDSIITISASGSFTVYDNDVGANERIRVYLTSDDNDNSRVTEVMAITANGNTFNGTATVVDSQNTSLNGLTTVQFLGDATDDPKYILIKGQSWGKELYMSADQLTNLTITVTNSGSEATLYYHSDGTWSISREELTTTEVINGGNHNKAIRFQNLTEGTYYLEETFVPAGYIGMPRMEIVVSADGKITANGNELNAIAWTNVRGSTYYNVDSSSVQYRLDVQNVKGTNELNIMKRTVGQEDWLQGAEFNLYYIDEQVDSETGNTIATKYYYTGYTVSGSVSLAQWSTNPDDAQTIKPNYDVGTDTSLSTEERDQYLVKGLQRSRTYYIVETKAPDGYNLIIEPIQINIGVDGRLYGDLNDSTSVISIGTTLVPNVLVLNNRWGDSNYMVLQLIIYNTPGFALPQTGGVGTHIYTFGGVTLMAIALAYPLVYGLVRRRRERRADR